MKPSKKTLLIIPGVILLAVVVGVLCVGLRVAPAVNHAMRISELLQPMLDVKNQTMHICVSTEIGGNAFDLESDIFLVSEDEVSYLAVKQNGTAVYVADNVLILENGKAFKIGDNMQIQTVSFGNLLPQIGALYEVLEISTRESDSETAYSITVTGEQAAALLAAASFGKALPQDGIETLNLCLTEKDGKLDQIRFSGNGELEGNSVMLSVSLTGFRVLASGDYPIPDAVKQSAATVNPEELFSLTEDLYRLVLALAPFADMDTIDGTMALTVDCGMLQLDTQMKLSDLLTTPNGQIDPDKLQALPQILGWLCMEGEITCTQNGDTYIYAVTLDQDSMKELSWMILPELSQYGAELTEGTASIILEAEKITSMNVSIEGKIHVLITQIPITVGAEFIFD